MTSQVSLIPLLGLGLALLVAVGGYWLHARYISKPAKKEKPYHVFSREFDREARASELLAEIEAAATTSGAPASGKLDSLLSRANEIAGQLGETAFDQLRNHKGGPPPQLTFLIDHSSSMKGARASEIGAMLWAFAGLLESADLSYEVLGYTTTSWLGGKSRIKWLKQDGPSSPGRLCDLLHIVYKEPEEPAATLMWALPLLTCETIFKENVDGEAIQWQDRGLLQGIAKIGFVSS